MEKLELMKNQNLYSAINYYFYYLKFKYETEYFT